MACSSQGWLFNLLEDYRGLVILFFCLPASIIFDIVMKTRIYIRRRFLDDKTSHEVKVNEVKEKDKCHKIQIDLHDILKFDESKMMLWAEANVTVRDVVDYLVPLGYTLAVTLEIGDATLGGLAFGVGMTTHSHKVGLYQETITEYEVVTAKGEVNTQEAYCQQLMKYSGAIFSDEKVPDFVEATIFDKDRAVVIIGDFVDKKDYPPVVVGSQMKDSLRVNDVCLPWKPWWYKHVEHILSTQQERQELVPLGSYLLRHNRAIFWVLESMIPFGNHPLFRLFFGWMCPPKPAFLKFTTTPLIREWTFAKQVFQDIVMPLGTLQKQVDEATRLFDNFPLLVYPCRIYDHQKGPQGQLRAPPQTQLVPGTNYAMFNDLGVYGTPGKVARKEPYNPTIAMREMEKFTREVGGYSFLYADIFMNEQEFEEMFDLTLYKKMRARYGCEGAFPTLYEKVRPEVDVISIGHKYGEQSGTIRKKSE